mgnify:CR=1 FL=1
MNNDQNLPGFSPAPFPSQVVQAPPAPPTSVEQQGPKKRGGRRGPRAPKPDVYKAMAKQAAKRGRPAKKTRKVGKAKALAAPYAADTGLRISVASAFDILRGLDAIESEALQKCILAVAGLGKKSRERVLAALARVVA